MGQMGYREKCLAQKINACNVCGDGGELLVHHINGDRGDDSLENLVPVCRSCHSKIHFSTNPSGAVGALQEQLPESAIRDTATGDGLDLTALVTKLDREKKSRFSELAEENGHTKSSQLRELVEIFLDVHEDE